jgi:hypothetical protein
MKRDWSATRQAEENLVKRQLSQETLDRLATYQDGIERADAALEILFEIGDTVNNALVVQAIGVLGEFRTITMRDLIVMKKRLSE